MKSKTIILSSQNNQTSGRGILTLYEENGLLQCKLRLYNIEKLSVYCKIGVYHNNEVSSANLLEKNGVYFSSLVGNFDINQDFFTAIIDTLNNNQVIISGGTYAGYFFNDEKVFNKIEKEDPQTDLLDYDCKKNEGFKSSNLGDISTPLRSAQHDIINDELIMKNEELSHCHSECGEESPNAEHNEPCEDCNKCLNCKYKEYFYSHVEHEIDDNKPCHPECSIAESKNPTIQELNSDHGMFRQAQHDKIESPNAKHNPNVILSEAEGSPNAEHNEQECITNSLVQQFKYVFENYDTDETLNNLIPNSKFVKINEKTPQGLEKFYSIGAIYDEDEMKYICYAVLCDYNSSAPQELGEHYQWLPIDKEDPVSEGYYIVFQDAKDLKIVEL